jgi:putative transposase
MPVEEKRALIEPGSPHVRIRRQCTWLGLARSSLYDQPVPESAENLQLMPLIDAQYTAPPMSGMRRMTAWLRSQGYAVHPKRVGRLLHPMGLEAISPTPRLRPLAAGHEIYPSFLRGLTIDRAHHVWSAAMTYLRLQSGLQFTSREFTARLKKGGRRISMDGCGRALDHVFVERLWRTVK